MICDLAREGNRTPEELVGDLAGQWLKVVQERDEQNSVDFGLSRSITGPRPAANYNPIDETGRPLVTHNYFGICKSPPLWTCAYCGRRHSSTQPKWKGSRPPYVSEFYYHFRPHSAFYYDYWVGDTCLSKFFDDVRAYSADCLAHSREKEGRPATELA